MGHPVALRHRLSDPPCGWESDGEKQVRSTVEEPYTGAGKNKEYVALLYPSERWGSSSAQRRNSSYLQAFFQSSRPEYDPVRSSILDAGRWKW